MKQTPANPPIVFRNLPLPFTIKNIKKILTIKFHMEADRAQCIRLKCLRIQYNISLPHLKI